MRTPAYCELLIIYAQRNQVIYPDIFSLMFSVNVAVQQTNEANRKVNVAS